MQPRPRGARLRLATVACAGLLLFVALLARADDGRSSGAGEASPELLGLVLDGREVPVGLSRLPATPDAGARIGIEALLRGLGLAPVRAADGGWQVSTPLGIARLSPSDVRTRDGIDFAELPVLARALGIELHVDERAAAVVATTTWNLLPRATRAPPAAEVIRPDAGARAPRTNLSYWRTEAYFSHGHAGDSAFGATDVGGALAGGFWRARYEDDLSNDRRLVDYAWVRTSDRFRWLLGHQQLNAHPLLGSIELTGAQMAWTNLPERIYDDNPDPGELVSGRTAPASNIVGSGPRGGVAELRFDGIVVARVPVALDGRYEFRDIPLVRGASTRVDVALYENGSLGAPIRIEDHSGRASDLLLPQGTVLHYLGAGRHGNPLDPDEFRDGSAAFYEARYGLLPGVTLDVAGQHVDGRDTWLAGGVFALGPAGVYSAHLAGSGSYRAWQVDGGGFRGNAYWRMLARDEDAGFRVGPDAAAPGSRYERYVEAGWRGEHLALSLLGRDLDIVGASEPIRYFKPGLEWYPTPRIYLSARPDLSGNYQYTGNWSLSDRLHAGAYLSLESDRYDVELRLSPRWRAVAARTEFQRRARHSLLFARDRRGPGDVGLTLAALESEGRLGYLASVDARLFAGITLRLQASDDPLVPARGPVLQLGLVADFAVTPQGLAANSFRRSLGELGGIAGALQVPAGYVADFARSGASVWIDGQRRTTVDARGRFNVGGLSPGVHRVSVDEGVMPIELRLDRTEAWVEVRAGVVTPMQFPIVLRLGFAGRVRGTDGVPSVERELVVEDATGATVAHARTDAWGYYRVDGLAPGRYRVRAASGESMPATWVELRSVFLFGIDLRD